MVNPFLYGLRSEPRFQDLVRRMNPTRRVLSKLRLQCARWRMVVIWLWRSSDKLNAPEGPMSVELQNAR
jgi:hypothetical protein